jgi:hypothetical protein
MHIYVHIHTIVSCAGHHQHQQISNNKITKPYMHENKCLMHRLEKKRIRHLYILCTCVHINSETRPNETHTDTTRRTVNSVVSGPLYRCRESTCKLFFTNEYAYATFYEVSESLSNASTSVTVVEDGVEFAVFAPSIAPSIAMGKNCRFTLIEGRRDGTARVGVVDAAAALADDPARNTVLPVPEGVTALTCAAFFATARLSTSCGEGVPVDMQQQFEESSDQRSHSPSYARTCIYTHFTVNGTR